MTIIERLNAKKEELENKHCSLVYPSIPKTILETKMNILDKLIEAYGSTTSPISLTTAQQILDQQIGFEEEKRKILERLEITEHWESRGVKNPPFILCLVGPSGVGKTTFAQIVAQALGKKFFSIALGGLSENSTIIGSEASSPANNMGRLAKAIAETKTRDPVILLDEIDKIGSSLKNCLLSFLDPTQNQEVLDYYLEVKLDFSQAIFVITANDLKKISDDDPLRHRMLVIEIPPYTVEQKKEITQKIVHKWFTDNGSLNQNNFEITLEALVTLISKTNEKGVRQLKMALASIFDYCLLQWAREARQGKTESKITISSDLVNEIIPHNFSNVDLENDGDNLANLRKEVFDLRKEKDKLTNILANNNQSKVKIARFHALNVIQQRLNKTKLKKEDLKLENCDYEEKLSSANSCEDIEIIREEMLLKIEQKFTLRRPKKTEAEKDKLAETKQGDEDLEKQLNDLRQLLSSEIEKLKKQLQSSQEQGKLNWSVKGSPWFFLFIISLIIGGFYGIFRFKNYNRKQTKSDNNNRERKTIFRIS